MVECNQSNISYGDESVLVDRVVRCHRYIPNYIVDNIHGATKVVVTGLFLVVPMYILPADRIKKARKNRQKALFNPEEFGLPGFDKVCYGTLRELSPDSYSAIAKIPDCWINEYITLSRHYEYVYLK